MVLTSSGGHQNTYVWQAGGTHPTGMLSYDIILFCTSQKLGILMMSLIVSDSTRLVLEKASAYFVTF